MTIPVAVLCVLLNVGAAKQVHAEDGSNSESGPQVDTPDPDDTNGGWLDSFRTSGRPKGVSLPKLSSKNQPRRRTVAELISQSEEGQNEPGTSASVPSIDPADPYDALETIDAAPRDTVSSEHFEPFTDEVDVEVHQSDVDTPIADQIKSRPPMTAEQVFSHRPTRREIGWQLLPNGLLYKTYLAGEKEPRLQLVKSYDRISKRNVDDATLGGRVGIVRYGTTGAYDPQGFQLDLEGAVFARVLPEEESTMLEGSDYRVGLYGTWREDKLSYRFGYYHISSHVGDEFLIANPAFTRINYVRDSVLAGLAYETTESTRLYGELGYAIGAEGGAEPLEFQFGGEYAPLASNTLVGAPFLAANRHLREDFDFDGGFNVVGGWGWQGSQTGRRLRLGLNYYRGPSLQYSFFDRKEELIGGGIWLDF